MPKKDSYKLTARRCQIMLEVDIFINKITPESVADTFTLDETSEVGLPWEWAARQSRLLMELLQDKEALSQYLAIITKDELEFHLESDRNSYSPICKEDIIFQGIYTKMESKDTQFFEKAMKDGILYNNTRLIHEAFVINWKGVEINDVRIINEDARTEA
jgi:hypothetical protein